MPRAGLAPLRADATDARSTKVSSVVEPHHPAGALVDRMVCVYGKNGICNSAWPRDPIGGRLKEQLRADTRE